MWWDRLDIEKPLFMKELIRQIDHALIFRKKWFLYMYVWSMLINFFGMCLFEQKIVQMLKEKQKDNTSMSISYRKNVKIFPCVSLSRVLWLCFQRKRILLMMFFPRSTDSYACFEIFFLKKWFANSLKPNECYKHSLKTLAVWQNI